MKLNDKLSMCQVVFQPYGTTGHFSAGTTILEAARELDIELPSLCGGVGICGKCGVEVIEGVNAPSMVEVETLGEKATASGTRLACEAQIQESCVVTIPQAHRMDASAILTFGERGQIDIEPAISKRFIKIPKPSLDNNPFDLEQLLDSADLESSHTKVPLGLLQRLPSLLRDNDYQGTLVTVNNWLVAFESGNTLQQCYGIAVDIGTTTIVGKLIDLNNGSVIFLVSQLNSQRTFGEDVISRIGFVVDNSDGLDRLHKCIINQLNDIIDELITLTEVNRENIYEVVCVGNTVMQHLLTKVDPRHLAYLPYVPAFRGPLWLPGSELGLKISPFGFLYIMPHIGRYVGGDTVGVILSAGLAKKEDVTLAVDIGTNGEIVLAVKDKIFACSTAAGPAFEGAHIKHGMRAADGAIDRVLFRDGDLYIHTVNDAPACGICGSGLIDAVGELLSLGVIDESGRVLNPDELNRNVPIAIRQRIQSGDTGNEILLTLNEKSAIALTQRDIREVQLAKGAIAAGIDILLSELGLVANDISQIVLAGAFGQFIRKEMAVKIGLLPKLPLDNIVFIGNGACAGAEMALLSHNTRTRAEKLSKHVKYVEISAKPEFQKIFPEKMMFLENSNFVIRS